MNWREHPKFLFLKDQIEKYINKGEKLGRVRLEFNNKGNIERCPLGAVAFNFQIPCNTMTYFELQDRFNLTSSIGIGFDSITRGDSKSLNESENIMIGEELALYCLENNWITIRYKNY